MDFTTIIFYLFSFAVIAAAVLVISSRNPVHSVLWLIFAFFNSAGLFVLLGAEMLAMLLVIVYVGAVAVLFLFVVMMLNIKTEALRKGFQAYLPLGLILAVVLFAELVMVINNSNHRIDIAKDGQPPLAEVVTEEKTAEEKTEQKPGKKEIVHKSKKTKIEKTEKVNGKEVKKETVEKTDADVTEDTNVDESKDNIETEEHITNAEAIGHVLYTQYVLYFEASGLILLVAMVGAIVLTLRHREGVRRQKISEQVDRKRADSIRIVSVETGKGVE